MRLVTLRAELDPGSGLFWVTSADEPGLCLAARSEWEVLSEAPVVLRGLLEARGAAADCDVAVVLDYHRPG